MIDETNSIFHLPCGDLCEIPITPTNSDDDESTTTVPDDDITVVVTDDDSTTMTTDDDMTSTYEYFGCYGDQKDRVLSGLSLPSYQGMTTEVCQSIRCRICRLVLVLEYEWLERTWHWCYVLGLFCVPYITMHTAFCHVSL